MRFALLVYRLLLRTYPEAFRRDHEVSMRSTFEALARRDGVMRALAREVFDVPGSAARLRSEWRNHGRGGQMELLFKDLRYAGRALFRAPGFTVAAIVSLALGIGVNAAIFGLVDAVLVKPMPVGAPQDLVAVYATRGSERFPANFSYPNYVDLAEAADAFSDVVAFQGAPLSLNFGRADPELVWCEVVSQNYMSGLRVPLVRGRGFSAGERSVAILSYDFWSRRFEASESAVGSRVRLNGHEFTIVGVTGPGFTGAKFLGFTPQLWVPIAAHQVVLPGDEERLERRTGGWLNLRARLTEGTDSREAAAALETLASRLEAQHPDVNRDLRLHLLPGARKTDPVIELEIANLVRVASKVLFAVVGIVLLIACANVASLQLARSARRRRELAVRLSIGATKGRLVRQLLLESLLLALAGGGLGLALGKLLIDAAMRLSPIFDFSIDFGASVDARLVIFTACVSVLAGFAAGFVPALRAARRDVTASLRDSDPLLRRGRGRRWIVIPQLALSLVALVSAGLLVRSFHNVRAASPGFAKQGVLLASVNLDLQGYDTASGRVFHRRLLERLRSLPAVEATSLGFPLPLDAFQEAARVFPDNAEVASDDEGDLVFLSVVDDDYFETMSTEIVAGRSFDQRDEGARPVAVVNETLARTFWQTESAIGRRFRTSVEDTPIEVIGVARDGKYLTLGEQPRPYFFLPLRQEYMSPITIIVRTHELPRRFEEDLRGEVRALDPTLPVYGVKTIGEFLGRSTAGPRALALTISLFALLALALAVVGIYGLMSFSVSEKRRHVGIRMALGATRSDVLSLFLKEAAGVVVLGLAFGLPAAWASGRLLSSLLFGMSPVNPLVVLAVVSLLVAATLAGSLLPSRRATKLDPIATLRHE